jgi:hypothetical protein
MPAYGTIPTNAGCSLVGCWMRYWQCEVRLNSTELVTTHSKTHTTPHTTHLPSVKETKASFSIEAVYTVDNALVYPRLACGQPCLDDLQREDCHLCCQTCHCTSCYTLQWINLPQRRLHVQYVYMCNKALRVQRVPKTTPYVGGVIAGIDHLFGSLPSQEANPINRGTAM